MKTVSITLAAIALACATVRAAEPIPTTVAAVTVYEDRALVSRVAEADLPAGAGTVRLSGFPGALSEPSLRALVEGQGVKVLSASSRTEQLPEAASEQVRAAEKAVDDVERQRALLMARRGAIEREEMQLAVFQGLARQGIAERAARGEADIDAFRKAAALFPERRGKLAAARLDIDKEVEALDVKRTDARANLQKISSAGARTVRTVDVALEAAQAGKARLTVSYLVHDCGWSPRYEARLVEGKLAIAYQGEVRQKTGEDWSGVEMALSTARPALGAKRPELPRARMDVVPMAKRAAGVRTRMEDVTGADIAAGEIIAGDDSESGLSARAEDTGLSVLFQVPGKADVPSDGRAHKVPVTAFSESPQLAYETVPKLVRSVYLRGDTTNKSAFPMLAGPVDIWRGGGFIGTSRLKFTAPGAPLALSLGADENLKVRRVCHLDTWRDEGILGGRRVRHYGYRIEVANYLDHAETVRIRENYPVSDLEEVKVELLDRTTAAKDHDAKQGLLMWELAIPSGETRSVVLEYQVSMPKDFAWTK